MSCAETELNFSYIRAIPKEPSRFLWMNIGEIGKYETYFT